MSAEDTLLNYLRECQSKIGEESYDPHPLIYALEVAVYAASTGEKGRNYSYVAGDEYQTPDKKPGVLISVTVKKLDEKIRVLEILDLVANRKLEGSLLEKIVHSEILIEKYKEQSLPIKAWRDILADTSGLKIGVLQVKEDVEDALKITHDKIRRKEASGLDDATAREILRCSNINEWANASPLARAFVGAIWSGRTGESLVLTPTTRDIPKWKVRQSILQILYSYG